MGTSGGLLLEMVMENVQRVQSKFSTASSLPGGTQDMQDKKAAEVAA